jgi:hypothetical protein
MEPRAEILVIKTVPVVLSHTFRLRSLGHPAEEINTMVITTAVPQISTEIMNIVNDQVVQGEFNPKTLAQI